MTDHPHTLVTVALPAEARPLIDHWRLQRDPASHAFPLYRGQRNQAPITLVVSGMGTINMAAACAHLYNASCASQEVWINIGLAGHRDELLGRCIVAHSIEDEQTGLHWYPPMTCLPNYSSTHLLCVGKVRDDYPVDTMVDMESGGYFAVATKYTTAELVQSVKIISDNNHSPAGTVDAQLAQSLIGKATNQIDGIVDTLCRLRGSLTSTNVLDVQPPDKIRLSTSQRLQFDRLAQRWFALQPATPLPCDLFDDASSGSELLSRFADLLQQQPVSFSA